MSATILRMGERRPQPQAPQLAREAVHATSYRDLLLTRSLVSGHDMDVAAAEAERRQITLAEAVVALGFVSEMEACAALAAASGLPMATLQSTTPSALVLRLVPERVARRHVILPLQEDNRVLTYASARDFDAEAERDIAFASGRRPKLMLAPRSEILAALDRHYAKEGTLEELTSRLRLHTIVETVDEEPERSPTSSPVVDFCNHLVARAVEAGASDIHIEPAQDAVTVRFRICGILESVLTLPVEIHPNVSNRYKVMARADIAVRHRPQDGAFRLRFNGRTVDIRLSTLPTIHGEKIVMRVIDSGGALPAVDALGYDPATLDGLRSALSKPDGLVLVTGPTGSGKTTALYAALRHLRNGRTNIVTVEDPVERRVDGINQIAVNGRSGTTFANVLRSVLRQDPNVIMVGEIRDAEVAQIVGQAAYTGHLVLSTLHTSDAAAAVTRLLNLGLEPFKVAESLTAIVAQRLIRRLCPSCKITHDDLQAVRLGKTHGLERIPASAGAGCPHCKHTGYADRIAVAEILRPDDAVRTAIARGATAGEIRASMRAAGGRSMREQALGLVAAGVTTIDEIDRVLAADEKETKPARRERPRVLVADDDRMTRMLVKLLLEREGYEVLEGENGQHAIEIARRERPDLLIIDLMMPQVDGYQAIDRIRRDMTLTALPVMVLTAENGPGIEGRVLELGADDYLVKPFDADVLLSRVRATFRRLERVAV